jgi:protoheme ferro-lyase
MLRSREALEKYQAQQSAYLNVDAVHALMRKAEEGRRPFEEVYHPDVYKMIVAERAARAAQRTDQSGVTVDPLHESREQRRQGLQMELTEAGRRWVASIMGHTYQPPQSDEERERKLSAAEAKRARKAAKRLKNRKMDQ